MGRSSSGPRSRGQRAVVRSDAPGTPVELAARPSGLSPLGDEIGTGGTFRMNLACTGADGAAVTYSFKGSPVIQVSGVDAGTLEPQDADAVRFCPTVNHLVGDDGLGAVVLAWADAAMADPSLSPNLTVDYGADPDWDGAFPIEGAGEAYEVISVDANQLGFWDLDPVLQAKHRWLEAGVNGDREAFARCQEEYYAAFAEVSAIEETLVAWLRSCHAKALGLMLDILAVPTLEVEAAFPDGTSARRSYRFAPADDLEAVANGRFDALYERCGLGAEAFDAAAAPFYSFEARVPQEDEADPRLTRPLATLTDVADAGA